MKKIISILMTLCITLSMSFAVVNAEDVLSGITGGVDISAIQELSLTIVDNTVEPAVTTTYSKDDVTKLLALMELVKTDYKFSGINNQGTANMQTKLAGIDLKKLLKASNVNLKKVKSIEFAAGTDTLLLNTSDLFAKRYYYSNLNKLNAVKGVTKVSKAKKKAVNPVIALDPEKNELKLFFGQKYASERNWPKFWGGITTITVNSTAEKNEKFEKPSLSFEHKVKGVYEVRLGSHISFSSTNGFIYYTMNGKKPIEKNAYIYNWAPKLNEQGINAKVFKKTGKFTVKAVVKGFGMKDSKTKTFKIKVLSKKKYDKKYPENTDEDTILPDDVNIK